MLGMQTCFPQRDDGQVDVDLGPDSRMLNETLNDCISSLPPRGALGNGPSCYWVDVAEDGLQRAIATGSNRPFTWGNITLLRLREGRVEARYDFDGDDIEGEVIEVDQFREILIEWRQHISKSAASATTPLPETYRRNPSLNFPP
jgi:hypothetical protein